MPKIAGCTAELARKQCCYIGKEILQKNNGKFSEQVFQKTPINFLQKEFLNLIVSSAKYSDFEILRNYNFESDEAGLKGVAEIQLNSYFKQFQPIIKEKLVEIEQNYMWLKDRKEAAVKDFELQKKMAEIKIETELNSIEKKKN